MRFGLVILPQYEWPEAGRLWRDAERLGFDHAWTYDHLAWSNPYSSAARQRRAASGQSYWGRMTTPNRMGRA